MNPDDMIKEVNARFAELTKMEQECVAVIQQKQADLNCILGAKQDCQFWLNKIMQSAELVPTVTAQDIVEGNPLDAVIN